MSNIEIPYLETGLTKAQFADLINQYSQLVFGQFTDDKEKQSAHIEVIVNSLNVSYDTAEILFSYWQKNKEEDGFFTSLVHCDVTIPFDSQIKELPILYCSKWC